MAVRDFMWPSVSGDRVNTADHMAALVRGLTAGDGVAFGVDDNLAVVETSTPSKDVRVLLGVGFVRGRMVQVHSSPETIVGVAADASLPRIDRVVLRRDMAARTVRPHYVQGTAASTPTAPALTQDAEGVWDVPLAQVYKPAGSSTVHTSNPPSGQGYITDERVWATGLAPPQSLRPAQAAVTTAESLTGSTAGVNTFVNLATQGPEVQVVVPPSRQVLVRYSAKMYSEDPAQYAEASIRAWLSTGDAANPIVPESTVNSIRSSRADTGFATYLFEVLHTFGVETVGQTMRIQMRYQRSGTATAHFQHRRIIAVPVA